MKMVSRFSLLLLVLLFLGCGDDDDMVTTSNGDGPLIRMERALDDVFYEWTDVTYDGDQNLASIAVQTEAFLLQTYEVTYAAGEPTALTLTVDNSLSGNTTVFEYDVIREGNEITLRESDGEDKFVYGVSDGYINYGKAFYGPSNAYFNETIFTRDADNNIDTIAYLATDANSTGLKVFEYTFYDHTSDFALPGVYNPVYHFSFTAFDAQFVHLLGLKISQQAPLQSSYWDAGGNFRAENITAVPMLDNDRLQELQYDDQGAGNDGYLLRFIYE